MRVHRSRDDPLPGVDCAGDRHGTYTDVRAHGCRCPDAVADRRRYETLRSAGRLPRAYVDSTGTVRRLQALVAMGYSLAYLAAHLDSTKTHVRRLVSGEKDNVHRVTAGQVAAAYRELVTRPPRDNPDLNPHLSPALRESRIRVTEEAAQRQKFAGPGRWGADIDNPDARPEPREAPASAGAAGAVLSDADTVRAMIASGADPVRVRAAYANLPAAVRRRLADEVAGRSTNEDAARLLGVGERTVERCRKSVRDADTGDAVAGAAAAARYASRHVTAVDEGGGDAFEETEDDELNRWRDDYRGAVDEDDAVDEMVS